MIMLKVAKKTGFHSFFKRYIFRKTCGRLNPPVALGLRSIFLFVSLRCLSEPNETRLITEYSLSSFAAKSMLQRLLRSSDLSKSVGLVQFLICNHT